VRSKLETTDKFRLEITPRLHNAWEEELKPYLQKSANADKSRSKFEIDIESFY
jgi:hypothetical protein